MENLILQDIMDVYQIEGRGTVVVGKMAAGWSSAKIGDRIVLRTPDGHNISTTIKDMELFRKGVLTPEKIPSCGILLADIISSDQLPGGTEMLSVAPEPAVYWHNFP